MTSSELTRADFLTVDEFDIVAPTLIRLLERTLTQWTGASRQALRQFLALVACLQVYS